MCVCVFNDAACHQIIVKAFLLGLVINTLLAGWENFVMATLACDGLSVAYWECNECRSSSGYFHCVQDLNGELAPCGFARVWQIVKFWSWLLPVLVLAVLVEAFLLGISLSHFPSHQPRVCENCPLPERKKKTHHVLVYRRAKRGSGVLSPRRRI
eukprot:SAG31_NODE_535_length_14348_cov_11.339603_9_plen_155_part_00